MLLSIPGKHEPPSFTDTDPDSPMSDAPSPNKFPPFVDDPREISLEKKERRRYLLAMSYFNTREFDRCAAVFLPHTLPVTQPTSPQSKSKHTKGRPKVSNSSPKIPPGTYKNLYTNISQKSLFLALYAKYLSGEKRQEEEREIILGPADGGVAPNRELNGLCSILEDYLLDLEAHGGRSQGFLEYLLGICFARNKNEDVAKEWLLRSVHIYPYNWGAWQELGNLLPNLDEVNKTTQHELVFDSY
jgi:anaphase-promoting complex subunit 8